MGINYVKGDATHPNCACNRAIIHICNNMGQWGAGFVVALAKRWPATERYYREWCEAYPHPSLPLGINQIIRVERGTHVVNMVAQDNSMRGDLPFVQYKHLDIGNYPWLDDDMFIIPPAVPRVNYGALQKCLSHAAFELRKRNILSVHAPRIGCGIGGGDWDIVELLLNKELINKGIEVTIYDFEAPEA